MPRITGPFEVKMTPQPDGDEAAGIALARFQLDKRYHGALDAEATGEMLSSATSASDARAYVAIERVIGILDGRRGSFVLLHRGVMTAGAMELVLIVAPGSGTGELQGLAGSMQIEIAGRDHSYTFEYTLGVTV